MYKRIILAYDGSASGQQALLDIQDLAHWERPKLTLVAVVPTLEMDVGAVEMGYLGSTSSAAIEEKFKEQLRKGVKTLRSMGFEAEGEILKGEVDGYDLDTDAVQKKKTAALNYCAAASAFTAASGGKPWIYLLIPHDAVMLNMTLEGLAVKYGT